MCYFTILRHAFVGYGIQLYLLDYSVMSVVRGGSIRGVVRFDEIVRFHLPSFRCMDILFYPIFILLVVGVSEETKTC